MHSIAYLQKAFEKTYNQTNIYFEKICDLRRSWFYKTVKHYYGFWITVITT